MAKEGLQSNFEVDYVISFKIDSSGASNLI